jgi:hypothetical protein
MLNTFVSNVVLHFSRGHLIELDFARLSVVRAQLRLLLRLPELQSSSHALLKENLKNRTLAVGCDIEIVKAAGFCLLRI